MPDKQSRKVPILDDYAAVPWSRSPELRKRYWTFMAILAVPAVLIVALEIAGGPTWIGLVAVPLVVLVFGPFEVRRVRRAVRRDQSKADDAD